MKNQAGYFSDGAWDCSHAFDPGAHRDAWRALGCPTDPEGAVNVVKRAWGDDNEACEAWVEANGRGVTCDSKGTVTPHEEYKAWRDAWQARAVAYVRASLADWWQTEQERRADKREINAWIAAGRPCLHGQFCKCVKS